MMQAQAQKIFKHFGREKQIIQSKSEYLELQEAFIKLSNFRLRKLLGRSSEENEEQLIYNCNEELADNILMMMQIEGEDFQNSYSWFYWNYGPKRLKDDFLLENFEFNKELITKIVQEKIDRTIEKYGID